MKRTRTRTTRTRTTRTTTRDQKLNRGDIEIDVSEAQPTKPTTTRRTKEDLLTHEPLSCETEPVELQNLVADYSKTYGEYVVGNRAVPDFRDGLKPVFRAALWAMHVDNMRPGTAYKKSARTVGNIIGKYHPHGDTAAYDSMVTIANGVMPNLIDGKGNWGSHVDNAAHYRYTECLLSKFTETFLLDKDYLNVVPMIENFDGTEKWPLFLPATLPIQLLIGSSGIAYGVAASTPSFKLPGVAKLVELSLKGKKITPALCKKYLVVHNRYGGECIAEDEDYETLYSTGKGSLRFVAEIKAPDDCKSLIVESCAPGFSSQKSIDSTLEKVANLEGVASVHDQSGRGAGLYGIRYLFKLKRLSEDKYNETYDKIEKLVSGSASYDIGYIHRKIDDNKFGRMSVCDFIMNWTKYRLGLERASIKYLTTVEKSKLYRQNLLLWGTDHIDDIADALKNRNVAPKVTLAKKWPDKSEEFINDILKLQVQQLAGLERANIITKIKEIRAEIEFLKKEYLQPDLRILRTFSTKISDYMKYATKNPQKEYLGEP
jgi:DNA gyrase/topoisomerase IV subunit A